MANILYNSISLNFKKETEIIKGNIIKTITKERIGLKCAQKLFIVYRDNAPTNNIFCNYLYNLLLHDYNNDPILNIGLLKCHFYS
jgi:hypothetical protein